MPSAPDSDSSGKNPTRVLQEFLRCYFDDEDAGSVGSLESYIGRFPGHEDVIRQAFQAVRSEGARPASSTDALVTRLLVPEVGEMIGPYRLERQIGRGGQGVVYLAQDGRLKRTVAIKILTSSLCVSEDQLRRFRREAEVASRLSHPGICPVFEMDVHEGIPYMVMPLVSGEPLSSYLARRRDVLGKGEFLDVMQVVSLVEELARALHHAHQLGVVHRDIKPVNIMVDEAGGRPVIMDFGVARDMLDQLPTLTVTGELLGTVPYMSPEQLEAGKRAIDHRTDVYSLGVVLYECLTFRLPFEAPTQQGIVGAILHKSHPDPRHTNSLVPRDLKIVLDVALDKSPSGRFSSAQAFAEELRRIREHEPIQSRPVSTVTRFKRWAERNPMLATTTITSFVVLIAGLVVSLALLSELAAEGERTGQALVAKQVALDDKQTALDEKQAALDEALWLADLTRFVQITGEMFELWPARPERADEIRDWLRRARTLTDRYQSHAARLEELKRDALPNPDTESGPDMATDKMAKELDQARVNLEQVEATLVSLRERPRSERRDALIEQRVREGEVLSAAVQSLEPQVRERRALTFGTAEGRWRLKQQRDLVWGLGVLLKPDRRSRTIAHVEYLLEIATSIERETIEDHRDEWFEAQRVIADPGLSPAYSGLHIRPQVGLIPLGADPRSGLYEFAHWLTGAAPEREPDTGELVFREDSGLVFVLLPGGTFSMGAVPRGRESLENMDPLAQEHEGPVVEITLDPFFISKYEMTQAQYLRFSGKRPSRLKHGADRSVTPMNPVETLPWEKCRANLRFLDLALPTEAQWEYAARGGRSTPWWTGEEPASLAGAANVADIVFSYSTLGHNRPFERELEDGFAAHSPVGSFKPNGFGLHDMAGNVSEWCQDVWSSYLNPVQPGDGLRRVGDGNFRACRGGNFRQPAEGCRSSARWRFASEHADYDLGLRPARRLER